MNKVLLHHVIKAALDLASKSYSSSASHDALAAIATAAAVLVQEAIRDPEFREMLLAKD